jgi:hypothetical protein
VIGYQRVVGGGRLATEPAELLLGLGALPIGRSAYDDVRGLSADGTGG